MIVPKSRVAATRQPVSAGEFSAGGSAMLEISLPGVTAPGLAVLCGAALVYVGIGPIGCGFAVAGLYVWADAHA